MFIFQLKNIFLKMVRAEEVGGDVSPCVAQGMYSMLIKLNLYLLITSYRL